MSQQSSPFLKIDSKQAWKSWITWDDWRRGVPLKPGDHLEYQGRRLTYAQRIIPSEYSQKLKIENYRYRWYQRHGTLGRLGLLSLQRAGDLLRGRWWWFLPLLYFVRYGLRVMTR